MDLFDFFASVFKPDKKEEEIVEEPEPEQLADGGTRDTDLTPDPANTG